LQLKWEEIDMAAENFHRASISDESTVPLSSRMLENFERDAACQ
jgi:hypothetical protein